jgi:hypothetical protein
VAEEILYLLTFVKNRNYERVLDYPIMLLRFVTRLYGDSGQITRPGDNVAISLQIVFSF